MAAPFKHQIDFLKAGENELLNIEVPLDFVTSQAGAIHGLAFWFDVCFNVSYDGILLAADSGRVGSAGCLITLKMRVCVCRTFVKRIAVRIGVYRIRAECFFSCMAASKTAQKRAIRRTIQGMKSSIIILNYM